MALAIIKNALTDQDHCLADMAQHPFIDIAVLDAVRTRFLAGDAIVVLDTALDRIIWANGAGAELFGYQDIEAVRDASANLGLAAHRQIMSLPNFPRLGPGRSLLVRLTQGLSSRAVGVIASDIALPGGETAIMLAAPDVDAGKRDSSEVALRAIYGIGEAGHHAALVDEQGNVLAGSDGFAGLRLPTATLRDLATEVAGEADRLAKRLVRAGGRSWPAGIALMSEDPICALVIVVDEPIEDRTPEPAASFGVRGRIEAPARPATRQPSRDVDDWYFVDARSKNPDIVAEALDTGDVILADEIDSTSDALPVAATPQPPTLPTGLQPANDIYPPMPSGSPAELDEPADEVEEAAAPNTGYEQEAASDDLATPFAPDLRSGPVRFVWKTDADGLFSAISPEFAAAVGARAADVVGRPFRDVAAQFALDPDGEIGGLLERRDTWSGRSVLWPIEGTDLRAPVDLAALPVYGRDRRFEGFRGFGVVRLADAMVDEEATGMALGTPAPTEQPIPADDPFAGETPAIAIDPTPERRSSDKVISLAEHRPASTDKSLSTTESNAFREIAARLREADPQLREQPAAPETGDLPPLGDTVEDIAPSDDDIADDAEAPWDDEDDDFATAPEPVSQDDEIDALFAEDVDFAGQPVEAVEDDQPDVSFDDEDYETSLPDTSILAKLPVPVLIHSGDTLHYANEEFFKLTGYATLDDLEGAGGLDALFAEPADGEPEPGDHRRRLRTRDGEEFPVEALLQSVPWGRGKALMLALKAESATDTAERPPAAVSDDIDARVTELQAILDTATDGIVIISNEGNIRSVSRPAEALFGFDAFELTGKPFVSLFAVESQRAARDYLAGLSDNGVASVLNDGREVIGRESKGRFIPLFMTIGKLPGGNGYCAVLRDITQWKRAEEDLTQARAEAERSSSQKTEFLARISHEIRTPLNAIIGFSELMIDEKFGPIVNDRYRDYLRDINRSGNHVLELVNDLLDISKIEAGEQEMAHEAVSLNETLAEAVAMMQPQANRERVIIRSSFASRLPEVVADQRSIRQIALNLLSNAVRYTQAGGQVIVSTSYEMSGDVVMRVRDTGVGMSTGEIEQAMKPFKQINALKRSRGDGTGLGLPLTKAMVEANRARFVLTSTPGEGTLVEITFPSTRVLAG